jgi:stage III sporulation protein AF
MIAVLGNLVRNLVVIIFVNTLLEMLLPRGQFHRYIRLVTGLIVIMMVVNAFTALLVRVPETYFSMPPASSAIAGVDEKGTSLWLQSRRKALALFKDTLTQLIRKEVEAAGWRFVEARFTLEDDPARDNFGMLYAVEVQVRALAGESGRPIEAVLINTVEVGAGAAGTERSERFDAGRVPELEEVLARRLQVSGGIISVVRLN